MHLLQRPARLRQLRRSRLASGPRHLPLPFTPPPTARVRSPCPTHTRAAPLSGPLHGARQEGELSAQNQHLMEINVKFKLKAKVPNSVGAKSEFRVPWSSSHHPLSDFCPTRLGSSFGRRSFVVRLLTRTPSAPANGPRAAKALVARCGLTPSVLVTWRSLTIRWSTTGGPRDNWRPREEGACARTHPPIHAHTHTRTHAHTPSHPHTPTHTRTHPHTHTHPHTRTHPPPDRAPWRCQQIAGYAQPALFHVLTAVVQRPQL